MQPSATENGPYDYTRSGNPTRDALERWDFMFGVQMQLNQLSQFILCFFYFISNKLHLSVFSAF